MTSIVNSDRPSTDGKAFHLGVLPDDVAPYCLLPGDPKRTDLIAQTWQESRLVGDHREHRTFTGRFGDTPITCCSTGVGGPSAANALEELAMSGAHTFIRVGTTGTLHEHVNCGDLIINTGAVRHDGTSDLYVEPAYPAFAHYSCVNALITAAEELGYNYHLGISCSTSSFYAGQGRPGYRSVDPARGEALVERMTSLGVLNFEMEAATLMTLGNLFNLRVGCVCTVIANRVTKELVDRGIEKAIAVGNRALQLLAEGEK